MKTFEIKILCTKKGDTITSKIVLPDEMRAADAVTVLETQSKTVQDSIRVALDKIGYKTKFKRVWKLKKMKVSEVLELNKKEA